MMQAYRLTHEILEKAPLGIYLCDSSGAVEYVNKAMLNISGETHAEFVRLNVDEIPTDNKFGIARKIHDAVNGVPFKMDPFEYTSYHGGKTSIRKMHGIPFEEETDSLENIFSAIGMAEGGEEEYAKQLHPLFHIRRCKN